MNETAQVINIAKEINELGVAGVLFVGLVALYFSCRGKKRMEDLIEGVKVSTEQMVELNKKYQSYYEKMIENLEKKEDKTLQIQEEILKEVRYNRDFYQKQLEAKLK